MKGKDYWWCDGCDKEIPRTTPYWLIARIITNDDQSASIEDANGKLFKGGDFCDDCVRKMIGAIERKR